jgi:hypothetical protein
MHLNDSAGLSAADLTTFFDELTFTGDDFTGANGTAPNLWSYIVGTPTIQSNKLRFSTLTNNDEIESVFKISGDFDIQIDFDLVTYPAVDNWNFALRLWNEAKTKGMTLERRFDDPTGHMIKTFDYTGSWVEQDSDTIAITSMKFKHVRSGSTTTSYYWDGSQWVLTYASTALGTDDIIVILKCAKWAGNPTAEADWDNFVINSGTVVWPDNTHPNRKKIAVTDEDGLTMLPVEIDNLDFVAEKGTFHVKVPTILNSRNKRLYLYFDSDRDSNALVGDTGEAAAQAVWDDNFIRVYHLSQDPSGGAGSIIDSSGAQHATPNGSMTSGDSVNGVVGKGYDFDGSNDRIEIPNITVGGGLTVEVLARIDNAYRCMLMVQGNGLAIADYWLSTGSGNQMTWGLKNTAQNTIGSAVVSTGWHYIAGTYDGTFLRSYYDGGLDAGPTTRTVSPANSGSGRVGVWNGNASYGGYANAVIDEVRISNSGRSDAWILATNHTLRDTLLTAELSER